MRPLFLACLVFAAGFLPGCSKSSGGSKTDNTSLIGSWRLLGQGGGISGRWNPATDIEILTFRSDSTYLFTSDQRAGGTGIYSLSYVHIQPGTDSFPAISMKGFWTNMGYSVAKDTLNIYQFAMDGYIYSYVRYR
ncbi:MAG TPA: hypothetical protein VGM89_00110 [Puia sp.]|jgi:hypothetical protein